MSFVVGVAAQSFVVVPQLLAWGFLFFGVGLLAASFFTKKEAAVIGICCLCLVLGITRLQISQFTNTHDPVVKLNDKPGKVTLSGTISDGPDVRDANQKLKVKIDGAQSIVLVTANLGPQYHYLDRIQIAGKLKTPAVFDDFSYKDYLKKDGIYSVMDFPDIKMLSVGKPANPWQYFYQQMWWFKQGLKKSIGTQFSPPQSSIVEGTLLGTTSGMSQEVKDKFSASGLTHLMAISGSNVVILSNILISFLLLLGLWRRQALYVSAAAVWLYIALAGFPASGIRATIMASIFLLAQALGRGNTVSRVMMLAAAVMLLQNPLSLRYDVGFQLSFLAVMGIVYGKPLLDGVLAWCVEKFRLNRGNQKNSESEITGKATMLWDIFSVTMAAQLFTLPVIAYNFNNISLVAPLTNLLIIPIIDFVMIFGFLAAFAGMFSTLVGFVFSVPAHILLLYFIQILNWFSQSWAMISLANVSWLWLLVYYGVVVTLVRLLRGFKQEYSPF